MLVQIRRYHLYTWVERGTVRVECLAPPGLEPGPLDPESSALTMRPPRLPQCNGSTRAILILILFNTHRTSGYSSQVVYYLYRVYPWCVCHCCHVADVSSSSESHLFQASTSSEEKVPFSVWDFFSLTHDFTTQHERKHQLVLFKQASVIRKQK